MFLQVFVIFFIFSQSCRSVTFFEKCKPTDLECVIKSAKTMFPLVIKGIPSLKLEPFDTFVAGNAVKEDDVVKINYKDITYSKMSNSVIKNIKLDAAKKKIFLRIEHNGRITFTPRVAGTILPSPIETKTLCIVDISNATFKYEINYSIKKDASGQDHWQITSHTVKYLFNKLDYSLGPMFKEDEQYREQLDLAVNTLKSSGKEFVLGLGRPMLDLVTTKIVKQIGKVFDSIPVKDMFLA